MKSHDNPYWNRGPIHDPAYFYGRSEQVTMALSMLGHLQSVSLVGPRRVGKTSMLHYISHASVLQEHGIDSSQYVFVLIDCTGLCDLDKPDFFQLLIKEALERITRAGLDVNRAGSPINFLESGPAAKEHVSDLTFRAQLRELLAAYFDQDELHTFCFDLGVDYDNLSGQGKEGKARALVEYFERNRDVRDLVREAKKRRPHVSWPDVPQNTPSRQSRLREREPITFTQFQDALDEITSGGLKLVFLFDEFEGMSHNENLDLAFFGGLRSIITNNPNVAYVTVSRRSLYDLTYAKKEVLGSPFFNIFTAINLGLFEDVEACALIEEPSRAAGATFSNETEDFILNLAGRHPLYIQIACYHAFDVQSRKGNLGPADYPLLRQRVESELKSHLRYAWDHLTKPEKQALLSLEATQDDPELRAVIDSLKNQGVICQHKDRLVLLCEPWADFVASQASEGAGFAKADSWRPVR